MANKKNKDIDGVGVKISAVLNDGIQANSLAGFLQEIALPQPDAVTLFELQNTSWQIEAYYPEEDCINTVLSQLTLAFAGRIPNFTIAKILNENWVAISQLALPPVHIGRFRVYGGHDSHRVAKGPGAIVIEAGEAFGTAHHATTSACLEAIELLTRRQTFHRVLDMGAGTGILSIAATRSFPNAKIIATDRDQKAVAVARANIKLNGGANSIKTYVAHGFNHPALKGGEQFDLIVANILAGPLLDLAQPIARSSTRSGTIVLSGLLNSQAPSLIAAYCSVGYFLCDHLRREGWSTLVMKRKVSRPRENKSKRILRFLRPALQT